MPSVWAGGVAMSTPAVVAACAVVATTCVLTLRRRPIVLAWQYALTGLTLAMIIGTSAAQDHDSDELLRRAKATCLGRGGYVSIESARGQPDRVYCAGGARGGYTLP
jgi:hypothetical protein